MEADFYDNAPAPQPLGINALSADYLRSAAKWGKFLAIVGFVVIGLMVVMSVFAGTMFGSAMEGMEGMAGMMGGGFFTVFYLLFALLYFFPVLYLYRFSAKMEDGLRTQNEDLVTASFKNLKSLLKFVGILTIVVFGFYALALLFMFIGMGIGSMM
ncbi:hypothetical protein CLV24_10386 [Pontibacter ummariensis]|uniref:DUF5362 domain-containing protein n=1 Tax=Pontibacter ummariensis TaxID=1610492 RepID=A0A239CT71_9BACT|nr:hypothetical protein [Pontibacter ummariensis]PRY14849.1 hypothetical protein CLV24_10386 [Pontibacter ummariensis]SNS23139.1 hypothetical protein SAMN06296052_103227 [Pontibacter ummariensis]